MADIKITDLVDQQAFDQLQKLQQDIDSVEQQYTKAARVLIQGLKVKVEVVGDLDKLTTIANSGIQQAAQATQNLTRAVQQQTTAVGQTTNVISRELSEVEKLNKAQRQQVDLDKDAVSMAREIVGTYQQQVQNLARVETELKTVSKQKKDLDDQYKSGAITQAQYQSQLANVIATERELKGEKTEIQQLMSIEEKMNQAVKGSYKELAQQLNMLEQAYMRLTEDEKQSPFGKRLAEAQIKLKQHMKDLDADMGNFQRNVGDYAIAGASLKSQLKDLVVEIATLTVEYRNMSEEERNSAAGQELAGKIAQLTEDAGNLKDAITDTNEAIGNAASDTRGFDQLGDALQTVTATFAVAKGAAATFGISTENVAKAEKELMGVIALMNGLQTIQTKLQSQSALMQGIRTLQTKAATVAEELDTAAKGKNIVVTGAATVAQKAFNAVAKANPYVLLATAIVTVVGALIAFKAGADDATESQKRLNDATANAEAEAAKARMQMEAYIVTINNFNGSAEQERALVDELNNQYGESVGYHEDLASWKDTLQNKCAQMAQALILEAQAQAVLNEYVAEYARLRQLQQQQADYDSMGNWGKFWDNVKNFRPGDAGGYQKEIASTTKSLEGLKTEYENAMLAARQFKIANDLGGHTRVNRTGGGRSGESRGGRSGESRGGGGKTEAQRQAEERAKYEEELQKTLKKLRADSLEAQKAELENLLITYQEKQAQITGNTKDEIEARELLSDEYEKACEEVIKKYADAQKQAEDELHKKHMEFLEETFARESTMRDQDYRMQQAELKQMLADNEITKEEYEKRTAEMSEQYAIETAEASIRYLETVLDAEALTTEERIAYAEKLADAKIALADATASKQIATEERAAEARKKADEEEKKSHEQKIKNAQDLMKASMDCMNAVADLASNIFEGQMQELEKKSEANSAANEAEIANIEALEEKGAISKEEAESRKRAANAKSKAQEEQIAKEKAALELKQAKLNKAMSIMTISLNTAMAVMNALATAPWPINIAMAALAGTTGAIQLAAAIAEPLPAYKDGTNCHPGGPAIVGDGGKVEGILLPNGKAFLTPDSPTMVNLPAGAKVIPDASTLNLDGLNPTPLVSVARSSDGSPIIINDYNDLQREIAKGNSLTKQMMKQQAKIARDQRYAAYIASRM